MLDDVQLGKVDQQLIRQLFALQMRTHWTMWRQLAEAPCCDTIVTQRWNQLSLLRLTARC